MLRTIAVLLVAFAFTFTACGETQLMTVAKEHRTATVAGELHQPGPPVHRAPVVTAALPPNASPEAKADGLVRAAGASCGRERWAVKTATDEAASRIKLAPIKATIAELGALPTTNNGNPDQGREPGVEERVYEVTAELVEAKLEKDGDFHLVLNEGGHTMIAEIPDAPACTGPPVTERVSSLEQQIEGARTAFIQEFGEPTGYPSPGLPVHHQVTVTGVGFFDQLHGQTGVAPQGIELHPVISLLDP